MTTDGLDVRARELVGEWPAGISVAGVFPESTDTDWCGRAALELAHAAAERRAPALILDLSPTSSGLARRFDARSSRGFAETAAGDVSLLDVTRRDDEDALYIPNGLQTAGVVLAGSSAAKSLADRVRERDGMLLAVLDRHGLRSAASAGWLDGVVRLGREPGDGRQGPGSDLMDLGRLEPGPVESVEAVRPEERDARGPETARGRSGGATDAAGNDPAPTEAESVPPLVMPDNHDPSGRWTRVVRRTLTTLAIVILTGVAAAALLDGSGSDSADGSRGTRVASTGEGGGGSASGGTSRASARGSSRTSSDVPDSPSTNADGSPSPSGEPAPARTASTTDDGDRQRRAAAGSADDGSRTTTAQGDAPPGTAGSRAETDRSEDAGAGESRSSPGTRSGNAATSSVPSSPDAAVRRLSETLVDRIRGYFLQHALLNEGKAECRELTAAYDRADRLFVQLSARFADVRDRVDAAARALYRERADDMEAVDRSFENSGCRG